ncbi:DUF4377 domain-containing protein [Larkinella sp. VNQ87]|uniref:DUF4377 domain-containing protein n=1 Tax=Larkinella sp. VNQ87 TaxID=3400921 RepID=UPI003BFB0928
MNRLVYICFLRLSLLLLACDENIKPEIIILQVADHQVDCTGVGPQKCLLIKEGDATNWAYFYQQIEGFEYTAGFEYKLRVRRENVKNPPADGSSARYVLVEVLEKNKT